MIRDRRYSAIRFLLALVVVSLFALARPAAAQMCQVELSVSVNGNSANITGSFYAGGGAWQNWAKATVLLDGGPGGTVFSFPDDPWTESTTLTGLSAGEHTLNWNCSVEVGSPSGHGSSTYYGDGSTSFTIP
jgi:hypothetical protein